MPLGAREVGRQRREAAFQRLSCCERQRVGGYEHRGVPWKGRVALLSDGPVARIADISTDPHVEANIKGELGLYERGGLRCGETAADGAHSVSLSGGCIGRGRPAMVTHM